MNLQRDQQKRYIAYLQNCDIWVSLNVTQVGNDKAHHNILW
jgi:hypothetical protein